MPRTSFVQTGFRRGEGLPDIIVKCRYEPGYHIIIQQKYCKNGLKHKIRIIADQQNKAAVFRQNKNT